LSEIRNCAREDIPAVAALFQKTFRNSDAPAPRSLEAYLADSYLDHPRYDARIASRVHVGAEGRVTGFIGVFPGRFDYRGRTVHAAIAGTLMVEHPDREPLAGAKLLRSVVKGPQDISISETTNRISQRLWEPLGGKVVPLLSLEWFRPLRPVGATIATLAEKFPPAALLAPVARAGDWIGRSWTKQSLQTAEPSARVTASTEISDSDFAASVLELAEATEFRPAWDQQDVEWLLARAARKERHGSLHRAIVRRRKGELVGCYLYHAKPGGVGRVLQVMARPGSTGDVLDCLFREADVAGLSGLRGRASAQLIDALLTRNCFFVPRASTIVHSADPDLAHAVQNGGALVTGLAGETWTRLIGGNFD
jgi:hypothetical protein